MKRLYVPGWGYPALWWKETCQEEGLLQSWGYYEEPKSCILVGDYWIIAHSFGLYQLQEEVRKGAQGILWYGGFMSAPAFALETARAFLRQPEVVLHKFRKRMFFPLLAPSVTHQASLERLLADVQLIASFDYEAFWQQEDFTKIYPIVGERDLIAQPLQSADRGSILPGQGHMPTGGEWETCIRRVMSGNRR